MELEEDTVNSLLETIRKEMVSIIEDGSESCENTFNGEKEARNSPGYVDLSDTCFASTSNRKETTTPKHDPSLRGAALDTFNISSIDGDIQKLKYHLDDSVKLFQAIGERFENINFGCLKNRVKDLHLNEPSVDSIKTIVNNLKHSFDEKYMENRLNDLSTELTSKFRNHPGEFGDIPEISEFFRTCSKLEHGLEKLRQQRDDCMTVQKRMTRVAETSYDRVNDIQQKIAQKAEKPQEDI